MLDPEFQTYSDTIPAPAGYYFRRKRDNHIMGLLDARDILATAMFDSVGEEGYGIAYRALKHLDAQINEGGR